MCVCVCVCVCIMKWTPAGRTPLMFYNWWDGSGDDMDWVVLEEEAAGFLDC